jgi:peptidoglycan L-alanyl-D-glutamate endopeptidase CwlK
MALVHLVTKDDYEREVIRLRQNTADCLAPGFRRRSDDAIADAQAKGFDVISFETCRNDELARLYFAHGVSKAPNALYTWHHYGLARDVISTDRGWDVYPDQDGKGGDPDWYRPVAEIFKSHGLDWGGDWDHFKDWPHWQFGGLRATPRDAVTILATKGIRAVWEAVGAAA